jgi:hypothetical protein
MNSKTGTIPLLSRGGVDATSRKMSRSLLCGADGVVWSATDYWWHDQTTPSARANVASRLFLDRAATPPRLRRGVLQPCRDFLCKAESSDI